VHIGRQIDPVDTTLAEGEDAENNQYTRYLLENYNIKVVVDWTAGNAGDFQQKVSTCIGTNTLPDAVILPNRNYLVQAARYGELGDLWDAFNNYSSKQVKQIVETTNGRAFTNCSVDGTFYAIPNITVDTDGVYIYFIRQDWLDQLGIEVPKTVDELGAAAKAFMEAGLSPDYAIAGIDNGGRTYSNFLNSSNNGYGFDALYQAFGATPGYFLRDEAGELYWGTTTDEMKAALTKLNEWYAAGLINPEVGTTTNGNNANNVKNGTCGIFMGPWWSLGYGNGDSFRNDPTANWQAYPLYNDAGEWNIHMKDIGTTYTVISANASEEVKKAVVIMNNVLVRDESIFDTSVAIDWYPLRNTEAAADECEYEYEALRSVLAGKTQVEQYQQGGDLFNSLYKNTANDVATLKDVISPDYNIDNRLNVTDMDVMTNNGQFNRFYALLIGDRPYATETPNKKIYSELYYLTDGMDMYWTQLSDLEDQAILQFITGARSLDEWDQFCADWHAQGGDEILKLAKDFLGN
jgi:multiple sugar transport system substrate-binding protein/putative aldouronate transport system substrate-binding protein